MWELSLDGEKHTVESQSGRVLVREAVRQIDLDGVLKIRGDGPLSVCYASAAQPVRARITDHLWLNYLPGRRTWKPGQEVSHWKATTECTN